ncbi:CDP-alcohol phosphatidyltransferase family protein [Acidipropionibacterium acidipropionici]|uniref:CDP-diacylglycerol--glycerol-3-phosphate 3-phosphatidyltransferase n=1 Tax=Acidipropionibacterium acidipropionici TaxID=1748 RepID=A0AAC8YDF4_9ACTN|nr:CDP-alcohol phosphatidyltransferase family protein [Acidipropionibacterium acidipropionici]AMS04574.1 CDP-diacylglycerol--glycerol-3-phosphate 3-phosphatidyltransferase [Acidipropionibacterium acidipropionici]AOZ46065.1 CDP-diacylglycerol--glycerol-3-phosphate 3-phosphatidyltransferase [Acidipropionibacterium acidipropionici]
MGRSAVFGASSSLGVVTTSYDTERFWTVPNGLSILRLLGVPVFLWLVLVSRADGWAVLVLAAAGLSDWLDGQIARRWHQVSRAGQILDPAADRLYILSTIVALMVRGVVPAWLVVVLVARDLLLLAQVPLLHTRGFTSLPVHFVGKAATFCLLYSFPLVLLGHLGAGIWTVARIVGWAFAIWGTVLYWWAGLLYARQTWHIYTTLPPAKSREQVRR